MSASQAVWAGLTAVYLCNDPLQLGDPDGSDSDEAEDEDDVEAALKKEVTQIQSSSKKRQRRFQAVDSGANNVVFICTHDVGEGLGRTALTFITTY